MADRRRSFARATELAYRMTDHHLAQQLRLLRRRVEQLQTEFQHQHLDKALFAEVETLMENGLSIDDRCQEVRRLIDSLREDNLITGTGDSHEAIRSCMRIKIAIDRAIADQRPVSELPFPTN